MENSLKSENTIIFENDVNKISFRFRLNVLRTLVPMLNMTGHVCLYLLLRRETTQNPLLHFYKQGCGIFVLW